MDGDWEQQVDRFCFQYLQFEQELDFPHAQFLKQAEVQSLIFGRLFADDALQQGPPPRYQLKVLKQLVSRIEASITDWDDFALSDDLMSALSMLLCSSLPSEAVAAQMKCYVTYRLSSLSPSPLSVPNAAHASPPVKTSHYPHITLLENRALIAASGTTGLRTWEAALHLGQFLCCNESLISGKHVLELGAGTGYVSTLCAKYLEAKSVIASDGAEGVVSNLPDNFFLNELQDSSLIRPMELKWGYALLGTEEEQWNGGRPVDVVLGADVTYNEMAIAGLVSTLDELFTLHPNVQVFISATQRREETVQAFTEQCSKRGLLCNEMKFEIATRSQQQGPFYSDAVPIQVYKISKSSQA